jgi:hypothetical protein
MNRQTTSQTHQQTPTATPIASGLLQRTCACGNHTLAGGKCEECSKKKRLGLQTKLTINEPGDIYEQEADRIADQVMAAPAHPTVGGAPLRIQRSSGQPIGQVGAAPASVDQALTSPGRPLEPALRHDMEQRFGYDFSGVLVHSDAAAEQSARDVNAHAYTAGNKIVFGISHFVPGTHEGRRLIAHELAHVVQQGAAARIGNRDKLSRPGIRKQSSSAGGQAAHPGGFGIRLELPTGERWIGPPILEAEEPPVAGGQVPGGESAAGEKIEPIEEKLPAISRSSSSQIGRRLQRRVSFTNPTPVPQDPLTRLISGNPPGLTTPTINGNIISSAADVLNNITPTSVTGSASGGATTCQFDSAFTIDTSANVIIANNPGATGWTGTVTPAFLGSPPACAGGPAVILTVMVARPSNADFVTRVRNSEQEHVDAIRELHDRHFVPYDTFLTGLRGAGPTLPDCATNLMAQLGHRPTQAGFGFVLGYAAETQRLDAPGGTHADTAVPTIASGCNSVTLTVSQESAPIPGASRGNVVMVAPTVTRYDHFLLSVSGTDVVETAQASTGAGAGTSRVVHKFSSAANARVGLHVFIHYGTTSKNVIGNMTYLLLDGNAAPSGSGSTLQGVTEESIDPARFQVTFGVPGASDWAIAQVDGNNVRIIVNLFAQRDEAFSAVSVLRSLGVTKFAFIGSRSSPDLMFFRL